MTARVIRNLIQKILSFHLCIQMTV